MNYETFLNNINSSTKELKDALGTLNKLYKSLSKDLENGDVKDLNNQLKTLEELIDNEKRICLELTAKAQEFNAKQYFESGDFANQLLDECKQKEVDVHGEYPIYEMFPYRIKLDAENQDIYIDRKKVSCARPTYLVNLVKESQTKLNKASFNAQSFLNELVEAYDVLLLRTGKKEGTDIYLTNLYKALVPMARSRKEYDQQSFAFDLARLYINRDQVELTKDGRHFQFGSSRDNNKAIRILDEEGKEQYLATINFFKE